MGLRAGFAEGDISPQLGGMKVGWIKEIVIDTFLDPIFARVAILESDGTTLAFIQLDTIVIRWTQVDEIRRRIHERHGIPRSAVMVSCTHNHAGPAVADLGEVKKDDAYLAFMVETVVAAFDEAMARLQPAKIGFGSVFEWGISHNRRMVMRNGTTLTHSGYGNPHALYVEGPIDPEVGVIGVQSLDREWLGAVVNFACHPTHHGGDTTLTAGFPGAFAREMKARGVPVALFINGAAGNLSPGNPLAPPPHPNEDDEMNGMGRTLADDAMRVTEKMEWRETMTLGHNARTISLPFRELTEEQIKGTVRGAQRFVDASIYDKAMPALTAKLRERGSQPAEVQAFFLDDHAVVGLPGEIFVQTGMTVKEGGYPRHVWIAGFTNGYIGYVPHRDAFDRGGYETTFGWGSKLAPEAADLLTECALSLLKDDPGV